MEISCYRYEEIKETVAKTLHLGKITKLPICPYTLADSLGIEMVAYSSLSEKKRKACFEFSDEGFILDNTIYYNDFMYEKRTRFTLMHEIGHIMLNHRIESDITEKEANFFAKYILAPPILIYAHDRTFDMDEYKIKKIFHVSDEISGYIYDYYKKWITQLNGSVPNSSADALIYNLFYNPVAM